MNEITIGDKVYISAKRAAEITGYARDYVGQLCREGHIDAKMVGRSWYVYEPAIRAHRFGAEAPQDGQDTEHAQNVTATTDPAAAPGAQEDDSAWEKPTYTPESPEMLPELTAPKLEDLLPPAEETLTDMQAAWREWFDQRQTQLEQPEIESPEVIDERNEAYEAAHEAQEAPHSAIEEDEEVSIPLHHLEDKEPVSTEEFVPIRRNTPAPKPTYAPVRASHVDIAPPTPSFQSAPAIHSVSAGVQTRYSTDPIAPVAPAASSMPSMAHEQHGRIISERIVRPQDRQNARRNSSSRTRGSNAPIIAALVGVSLVSVAIAAIGTGYANRYLSTLPAKNNPAIKFLVGTRDFTRQ